MSDGSSRAEVYRESQSWGKAYRLLAAVPRDELDPADLELLATSAYLVGEDDDAVAAWEAAHQRHLDHGDRPEAARCAFWAAFCLMVRGQVAHAGGWLSRAEGLIGDTECSARGFLKIPALLRSLDSDDPETARDLAVAATTIAERVGDPDLAAFGTLGHGQALIALGNPTGGVALLDEVMLSVETGDVGPIASGIAYCAVVLECMQLFDLARAAEWTASLDRWCSDQPDLVPYRGQCLVHQSQLQQAAGDWETAAATVGAARERLTDPPHPALGLACYQQGDLHRHVGDLDAAAEAYAMAARAGRQPLPGLALLELARGDAEAAVAGIDRALGETTPPLQRPPLLSAAVEIHRAAGDLVAARSAADELNRIAEDSTSDVLKAMAAQADGAVLLAEGSTSAALGRLRLAGATWTHLSMPYDAARVSVLLGLGCMALGDSSSASIEFDRARETFTSLGARPDLDRLAALSGEALPPHGRASLSERELEVLALVAAGKTNREVAEALIISPHTVGRHLENIYAKFGVGGRAAATAYAYEHHLL
jgi:DNA-binding CsgD family transcriptional regulator